MNQKPTVPEVIDRFKAYHDKHPSWGSLHIVLDDLNLEEHFVRSCILFAVEKGDLEGGTLASILLDMSKRQRRKIAREA